MDFSSHPQGRAAASIVKTLQDHGYEALVAGGAVRDAILGRVAGDLDIATKATPDEVESLFPQTLAVGKAFGVIRVLTKGQSIEVATYRLDQNYKDGRRPESVQFTSREEDAKRRDFTVNALYYDLHKHILYDDVGGLEDLESQTLRAVGQPSQRFSEDELRRLRLIRFVSQLGFTIEPETWRAVQQGLEGLTRVSRERITEEVQKMWKGGWLPTAFPLFLESGMAQVIDSNWEHSARLPVDSRIWKWSRVSSEESWAHYFSFHWRSKTPWENSLSSFKLPKDLQKNLKRAAKAFQEGPSFLDLSWAEQRLLWVEPLAPWALRASWDFETSDLKRRQTEQLFHRLQQSGPLPAPLMRGEDLKGTLSGPELGKKLQELYRVQLNEDWTHRDQAFQWIRRQGWKLD